MLSIFRLTLLSACLFSLTTPSFGITATEAIQKQPSNIFYQSGSEGWYWYQDPVEEEEIVEEKKVVKAEVASEKTQPQGPEPFTLKWVQEMLPKYKETAWNHPTQENVQAYYIIQRFAMDRANEFADVAQQIVVGNPLLDESMRRPLATFATFSVDAESARNTDDLLRQVAKHAGVFFFFRSDCKYCELQAPLVGFLEDLGFEILAVSIDGGALQSRQFKNTKVDNGQAIALGVQSTPALFLMNEEGHFTALGQTVLSLSELRKRILLVAQREGWITREQFQETQPILNPNDQRNLSSELPRILRAASGDPSELLTGNGNFENFSLSNLSEEEKKNLINKEDGFIEPSKLIALFGTTTSGTLPKETEDNDEN